MLSSGRSSTSIQSKTITILYGSDFCQIQSINFVSLAENAEDLAKEWTEYILRSAYSQHMQNLSYAEQLMKQRSILLYGKAVLDEKLRTFCVPMSTFVDSFVGLTNSWRQEAMERQNIINKMLSVGLPCKKTDSLDEETLTEEKFFQFFFMLIGKGDIEQIFQN